jgi:hypothetical protein
VYISKKNIYESFLYYGETPEDAKYLTDETFKNLVQLESNNYYINEAPIASAIGRAYRAAQDKDGWVGAAARLSKAGAAALKNKAVAKKAVDLAKSTKFGKQLTRGYKSADKAKGTAMSGGKLKRGERFLKSKIKGAKDSLKKKGSDYVKQQRNDYLKKKAKDKLGMW